MSYVSTERGHSAATTTNAAIYNYNNNRSSVHTHITTILMSHAAAAQLYGRWSRIATLVGDMGVKGNMTIAMSIGSAEFS